MAYNCSLIQSIWIYSWDRLWALDQIYCRLCIVKSLLSYRYVFLLPQAISFVGCMIWFHDLDVTDGDFVIFYLFSWSYSSSPSLLARIKFHHFQLMLQLNQLNPSWVTLLHNYLLTSVQNLLLQRLWDRCIKVRWSLLLSEKITCPYFNCIKYQLTFIIMRIILVFRRGSFCFEF